MIHLATCEKRKGELPFCFTTLKYIQFSSVKTLAFHFGCIRCIYLRRNECGYVVPVQAQTVIYRYL